MMTARIITSTGEVVSEIVAARTELLWDAQTNDGRVTFYMEKITTLDGVVISRTPAGTLQHGFNALMGRTWDVPIDELGNTTPVPTMLLMATIKEAFDILYNESVAPPVEEVPPPEPEPEP